MKKGSRRTLFVCLLRKSVSAISYNQRTLNTQWFIIFDVDMRKTVTKPSEIYKTTLQSRVAGETNDCSVIAISILSGLPYAEVHAAFEAAGRKPGKGTYQEVMMKAVTTLGLRLVRVNLQTYLDKLPRGGKSLTTNTANRYPHIFDGAPPMLVHVSGHALALMNNKVHDWSANNQKRIVAAWEVHKA